MVVRQVHYNGPILRHIIQRGPYQARNVMLTRTIAVR